MNTFNRSNAVDSFLSFCTPIYFCIFKKLCYLLFNMKTSIIFLVLCQSILTQAVVSLKEATHIDQHLSDKDRQFLYNQNMGTELVPADWIVSLEMPNTPEKFVNTLTNYGFIYSPLLKGQILPIGLVVLEDLEAEGLYKEKKWLSINCSACHTGSISIGGRDVIVDGGASHLDLQRFNLDMVQSLKVTLNDTEKFNRFTQSLGKNSDLEKLNIKLNIEKFLKDFSIWTDMTHVYLDQNRQNIPYGPGRMDGFGGPTNQLTCLLTPGLGDELMRQLVTDPRNCGYSMPPSSIPSIWGSSYNQWMQWPGMVHSIMGRDVGVVTGAFGRNWVKRGTDGLPHYQSTVDLRKNYEFQEIYGRLRSPSWQSLANAGFVKAVDIQKANLGQKVYQINCLQCHAVQPASTSPNKYVNSYWNVPVYSAQEVGTDEGLIDTLMNRKGFIPKFYQDSFRSVFGVNSIDAEGKGRVNDLRTIIIGKILNDTFSNQGIGMLEIAKLNRCRENIAQPKVGYKATALDGIAFTAPYLHNGSVSSLRDLLKPARDRSSVFLTGCKDYDSTNLGFVCTATSENTQTFDTRLEGNSNKGHEYGVNLSELDKDNLLEFIKTIEFPILPPQNILCH